MTTLPYIVALLLFGQVTASPGRSSATADGNPVVSPAFIRVRDEAKIPAMEAGMLTELTVREGSRVKKGDTLAQTDDRRAQAGVEVAEYAEQAAKKRVEQDIEERYAMAASAVAKAEYNKALEANRITKNAVSQSEVERAKLDHKRAELQIEKAANDRVMAGFEANTKTAELEAARMALDWLTIRAPFDGDVVKTYVHESEWVNPGDPILKLMRFDKLYIEGDLYADEYDRAEVKGKPVTVEVVKARGRKVTVSGTIVHVDQLLMGSRGRYTVRAEVENELVNDSWLLQPGGVVRMTIHMNRESRVQSLEPEKRRR